MTVTATFTPPLDAVEWPIDQPVTVRVNSDAPGATFDYIHVADLSDFTPAAIIYTFAQAGWIVTLTGPGDGPTQRTVSVIPVGGWEAGRNYNVVAPAPPYDAYPLGLAALRQAIQGLEAVFTIPGPPFIDALIGSSGPRFITAGADVPETDPAAVSLQITQAKWGAS